MQLCVSVPSLSRGSTGCAAAFPDRLFPEHVDLPHDYAAWYAAMVVAKEAGRRTDWESTVPPLRQYPPGSLTVSDPYEVCVFGVGHTFDSDSAGVWELESPVSRPIVPLHSAVA